MTEQISRGLYRLAKLPIVLICLLVFLIFSATQLPAQSAQAAAYSADAGTPDTSFFYTPAELNRMAERFGSSGRQAYIGRGSLSTWFFRWCMALFWQLP
jgi:hypothetical protein